MKAAEIVRTVWRGALRIDIRRYKKRYFGFEWQDGSQRKQVLLLKLEDAERRAKELLELTQAGMVDLTTINRGEYEEFLRWKEEHKKSAPVPAVVKQFMATKEKKGVTAKTLRGLRHNLELFARNFTGPINQLRAIGVEAWIEGRNVGPRRWNNILADIISLIRYARRVGLLPAELTEVEKIDRKKVTVTVHTYTPAELEKLIKVTPREWRPVIVIGAFCGLRPEEIAPEGRNDKPGLAWENVLWEKGKVDVPAAVSKTRRRRFAPLPEAAIAWLAPYRDAKGPVCPVDKRFCHYLPWITKLSGVEWKADALRHSFASYRLALIKDLPALALEMGNSPAMIYRHYLDLQHEPEAKKWFSVMPEGVNGCEFHPFQKRSYRVKQSARGGT